MLRLIVILYASAGASQLQVIYQLYLGWPSRVLDLASAGAAAVNCGMTGMEVP